MVSPNTTAYPNTVDGLKNLLLDMRVAAKAGNQEKLAAFIKDTEIPNCAAWLHSMYDSDKADSWMGLCEAKSRDPRGRDLKQLFERIATQDGKFITRKVNDNPQPGKGLEWGWLQAIKQPLDIYWASWLPSSEPKESEPDPIGYLMFIEGGFRWESGIQSIKPSQIKRANIVMPKLTIKVDPVYPPEAAASHTSGTVRVRFVIGTDGIPGISPHANKEEGFSDDLDLVKAAESAVRQWRYVPLTVDGQPRPLDFKADIVFSLKN
jgi:TonB family protein